MPTKRYLHVHPLTILENLWRVFYLIVIPVLRGFFSALQGGFAAWVRGAWVDILILLLMLALAVLRWYRVGYWYNKEALWMRSGLLFQKQLCIPWQRVVTLSAVKSFYLRPFRAVRVRVDTLGGSFQRADGSMLLRPAQVQALLRARQEDAAPALRTYRPHMRAILATALLTSNSFAGIVFLTTFVSQAGKVFGNTFTQRLIDTFEVAARRLALGIPPAAAAIAYALLAGWLLGFCLLLTRYKSFTLTRTKHMLNITAGIFTKRKYAITYDSIHFIDIRQSLITKLFRLFSAYVSVVGYGKQKDDLSCVILTESAPFFHNLYSELFPALPPQKNMLRPVARGILRFIGGPLCLCGAILAADIALSLLFPRWVPFLSFVSTMLLLLSLYFLLVRIVDFRTCGVSKAEKHYTIRYSKGFYLHTVMIPVENIVLVEVRQGVLQRFGQGCDLRLHTRAEGKAVHLCRNLNRQELKKLFGV